MQNLGEAVQVVLERFPTGDHREGCAGVAGVIGLIGQRVDRLGRMGLLGPGVLGVTPGAAHIAPPQSDEKGAPAAVVALPLEGVEGLHHRERSRLTH